MKLTKFMRDAGFKILALSGLDSHQYSIILYLINCAVSGMDIIQTTYAELSSLMGCEEEQLKKALIFLKDKKMIRMLPGDSSADSVKISFEFEVPLWKIEELTHHDALVFPFLSNKRKLEKSAAKKKEDSQKPSWNQILEAYLDIQGNDTVEVEVESKAAHVLADTHPTDQVLLFLKHFGKRIKTLSLLASSWQHFQETYESETQKIDIEDARKKHHALDEQLRNLAKENLLKAPQMNLTEDEIAVLKVIIYHQHPRRQLYWAYKFHDRYPNLENFFSSNTKLMLSITTHGTVVKKSKSDKKDA